MVGSSEIRIDTTVHVCLIRYCLLSSDLAVFCFSLYLMLSSSIHSSSLIRSHYLAISEHMLAHTLIESTFTVRRNRVKSLRRLDIYYFCPILKLKFSVTCFD